MQEQQLAAIVEPILAEAGLELDSIAVTPIGKRRLLRIIVDGDGPSGHGPMLDDISAVSALISSALDESPIVGNAPYTLEVSSRGVDKPLTEPKHYRRSRGRLVRLSLEDDDLIGRIIAVTDSDVELHVDGAPRIFAFSDIRKAQVQVELNPPKEYALPGNNAVDEEA
ncbi:MAG: ribosome maturation factor RimP [Propionibacteriaceae bacterium]|nr:ribosome maturation factor RimP [Propionibacteriaceae bacterium]